MVVDSRERIAARVAEVVGEAAVRLRRFTDAAAAVRPAPGKWCAKELLGHLIDSAANNHQRFVRAQEGGAFSFPGYEQESWVRLQGYADASWSDLVELWRLYNLRLAELIRRILPDKLAVSCRIGAREPVALGWIVEDYLRHLEHHLGQIEAALR